MYFTMQNLKNLLHTNHFFCAKTLIICPFRHRPTCSRSNIQELSFNKKTRPSASRERPSFGRQNDPSWAPHHAY
jgi:hypothetical protein